MVARCGTASVTLDATCVDALEQVLADERLVEPVPRRATSARRARTRPATPAAETS
jgi:hypothetical protein